MKCGLVWPLPRRYVVGILTFLGMIVLFSMRVNLSVAVVSMTTYRTIITDNGTTRQVRDFNWDSKDKGYILSSFFYGYLIAEFPCAWLGGRFGGTTIFGLEVAFTALFTILMPLIVDYGVHAIFLFRALAGIFEGGTFPVTQCIWSRWAPSEERTILTTLTFAGSYTANVICYPAYGYMSTYFGWKSLFYVPGIAAFLWCIVWFIKVTDDPGDDLKITETELAYIRNSVQFKYPKQIIYPWKAILTSMPVWANIVGYFTLNWGYVIIFVSVPMFLNDVWNVDVKDSGVWLIGPYVASALVMPTLGFFADYLRSSKKYPTVKVRKLCQIVAGFGSAIFISLFAMSPNPSYAIILLILLQCCVPFAYGSILVNALDIAPQYANVIMAMCCTIGGIAALIAPVLAGYMVTHKTQFEWIHVYLLSGTLYVIGTIFYLLFCSGEIQSWAKTNNRRETDANVAIRQEQLEI